MLIKIIDNEALEQHLDDLKRITGTGSASKSVAIAASNFVSNLETIEKQSERIKELENVITRVLDNRSEIEDRERDIVKLLDSADL
jgi:hypothetical protein